MIICFLGADGSGKSTVIDELFSQQIPFPFDEYYYFHLKPLKINNGLNEGEVVSDPHKLPLYSAAKSYLKLFLFVIQYNIGWLKNISPIKRRESLVIFDRYYDDLLVDNKRYRYGGSLKVARFIRNFIPRPELYFILTCTPQVIYERKQEVPFVELERQVKAYDKLVDSTRYIRIAVDRPINDIVKEIITIMSENK